jgi:hypothetical protein
VNRTARASFLVRLVAVAALVVPSSGCKLLKKQHPSGKLARTVSPAQYTDEYPDQPSPEWFDRFDASKVGAKDFDARDTGKLHVWLRYGCTSKDGSFKLDGKLGYKLPGKARVAPVPVTVTDKGVSMGGLPRGADAMIVINAPRPSSARDVPPGGAFDTDGYIYLFDLDVPTQGMVTLEGWLAADRTARCIANTFEIWRD